MEMSIRIIMTNNFKINKLDMFHLFVNVNNTNNNIRIKIY